MRSGSIGGDAEHVADGAELAAEPRPWQRMSWLRAKRTMEFTVRKYGAYCSVSIRRSSCLRMRDDLVGHAFGIALGGAFPGQLFQRLLRREARHGPLFGILIGQFVEREAAALGDLDRARQRLGIAAEEPRHFLRRFEIAVGMALAAEAGVVDGAIVPDAGDDILQDAPRRLVEQDVVGDDGRHARLRRQVRQLVEAQLVVRAPAQGQRQIGAVAESLAQAAQAQRAGLIRPHRAREPRSGPRHRRRDRSNRAGTCALPPRFLPSDSSRQRRA